MSQVSGPRTRRRHERGAQRVDAMKKTVMALVLLAVVAVGGGALYLMTVDMPAPTATIEKVIPNERLVD